METKHKIQKENKEVKMLKNWSKVKSRGQVGVGGPKHPLNFYIYFLTCDQIYVSIESMEGYPPPPIT